MSDASQLTLRIEKPVYGGAGLARHEGRVIFTPFTLPGELVTAQVTHAKASFAEAHLKAVLEPAPERSQPPCPYFGVCGGCHYQHANYPAQLAIKRAILTETLTRAGLTHLPEITTHAGEPFGYRNRIRLHLDPAGSALGYRERASHRLLSVEACPIAAPLLQHALGAFATVSAAQQVGHAFSEVEFSTNHDASELLLALWLRSGAGQAQAQANLAGICEALQALLPVLRGGGVHAPPSCEERPAMATSRPRSRGARSQPRAADANRSKTSALDDGRPEGTPTELIATWGTPSMTYRAAGHDYRVSLGAFFQVNRTLVDELAALATAHRTGTLAWDLYAGVGLFSKLLASRFEQVIAVEGAPVSSRDLAANLTAPHQAVCMGTGQFLAQQQAMHRRSRGEAPARSRGAGSRDRPKRPDFVLVDPPRAGLGSDSTRMLSEIGPQAITYVSCDPATLARDLRAFVESGYQLQQLHLIDLFPQTFHLETVAMLSLG